MPNSFSKRFCQIIKKDGYHLRKHIILESNETLVLSTCTSFGNDELIKVGDCKNILVYNCSNSPQKQTFFLFLFSFSWLSLTYSGNNTALCLNRLWLLVGSKMLYSWVLHFYQSFFWNLNIKNRLKFFNRSEVFVNFIRLAKYVIVFLHQIDLHFLQLLWLICNFILQRFNFC